MTLGNQDLANLSPDERRALLAELLQQKARASRTTQPVTYGQKALWFIYQLAPESAAYNVAFAVSVHSPLDVAAMRRAYQHLIDRHSALRTTISQSGETLMQIIAGSSEPVLDTIDASQWNDNELHEQVQAVYERPFDLERGPLHRMTIFTRSASEHVLLLAVHHIVVDGMSLGVITDELFALYRAEVLAVPAQLPAVEFQFDSFAAWQNALLKSPNGQHLRDYWLKQLGGELPLIDLPIDKRRIARQQARGAAHRVHFGTELLQQARALAKAEHTTLYTVLLAVFYLLLYRYTDQEDLVIGSPMAGRSQVEFQKTVGYLVSQVALRIRIDGTQTFHSLLGEVRRIVLEAFEHQDYPIALVIEQLNPRREGGRMLLMDVMFNLIATQHFGQLSTRLSGNGTVSELGAVQLQLENYPVHIEDGEFDLNLVFAESKSDLTGEFKYNSNLFEEATIARLSAHYQTLLENIIADPTQPVGAIPILTDTERQQLLESWNSTEASLPKESTIHDLFVAQAQRTPDRVAVATEDAEITYGELDRRSNQLARHLRAIGVAPGTLVGVLMHRTVDMVVALFGVLKAGGAYVPIDPGFPAERLAMMLSDSHSQIVLTEEALADAVPTNQAQAICIDVEWPKISQNSAEAFSSAAAGEDLAYIIFTSGSTGRPKGVQIPHRAVVNFLQSMRHTPGLAASDVLGAVTTLSFDITVLELYLPLITGARIALFSREVASNGVLLAEELTRSGVTVMQATPVTWRFLLAADWRAPAGFRALCGGEALPEQLARDLLAQDIELWNMYGPTETTVWSTVQHVTSAEPPIRIGRPIDNTELYILDKMLQPVPIGVAGTLYIGGAGLAHGYLDRPDLTEERFIRHPFSTSETARLYNTGDTARYHADGTVEVLGRTDHQVKIRGFRIELGEIEAAIERHPAVREAVVSAQDDGRGSKRLLAYLTHAGESPPQTGELRIHLRSILPDYMIPAAFIALNEMPRTPNGKVNRNALPAPEQIRAGKDDNFIAPSTDTEQVVATIWREILNLPRVGVYDNFFDLGGHSLNAMEVIAACERTLGVRMNPGLFRAQTLGQIAASYDEMLRVKPAPAVAMQAAAAAQTSAAQTSAAPEPAREQSGLASRIFGAVKRAVNTTGKDT